MSDSSLERKERRAQQIKEQQHEKKIKIKALRAALESGELSPTETLEAVKLLNDLK